MTFTELMDELELMSVAQLEMARDKASELIVKRGDGIFITIWEVRDNIGQIGCCRTYKAALKLLANEGERRLKDFAFLRDDQKHLSVSSFVTTRNNLSRFTFSEDFG